MDRDPALLLDIVIAAKDAQDFVKDMNWEGFMEADSTKMR